MDAYADQNYSFSENTRIGKLFLFNSHAIYVSLIRFYMDHLLSKEIPFYGPCDAMVCYVTPITYLETPIQRHKHRILIIDSYSVNYRDLLPINFILFIIRSRGTIYEANPIFCYAICHIC